MPTATFVPPPGLVEGLGAYAYLPPDYRQALYNQLYSDWLTSNRTADLPPDYERSGPSPGPQAIALPTTPFQGIPLSPEDRALLDKYEPNWKYTPKPYQTENQLNGLIAAAQREKASQERASTDVPVKFGPQWVQLSEDYRMRREGDSWYLIKRQPRTNFDTVNGVPVSMGDWRPIQVDSEGKAIALTGEQANAILNMVGALHGYGRPGLARDRFLVQYHMGGKVAGLSEADILGALSTGSNQASGWPGAPAGLRALRDKYPDAAIWWQGAWWGGTPVNGRITYIGPANMIGGEGREPASPTAAEEYLAALSGGKPTIPILPTPGLEGALASEPTRPGYVTPENLASAAAQDTIKQIAAELAKRTQAEEEPTMFAGRSFPGYQPIKLRPRT